MSFYNRSRCYNRPMLGHLQTALAEAPPLLHELAQVPGLWLAGGWLRDACWGRPSSDFDLAAAGSLEPALARLARIAGRQPFRLNARFESYGIEIDGAQIDLMPLHPAGVAADVARRDYTVNSLLFPLDRLAAAPGMSASEMTACLAAHPLGWIDLEARHLRMTDAANLAEDPLRLLRGYRLAAQWDLTVDPATRATWRKLAGHMLEPAPERLHDELLKLLGVPCAAQLRCMAEDGVLWQLFPPLAATVACDQLGYHHLDVWQHTLLALQRLDEIRRDLPSDLLQFAGNLAQAWDAPVSGQASAGALTRLALLLHDVAKPPTREVRPDGRASFHGHQEVGAQMILPMLDALRFSKDEQDYVALLIRQHMRLGYYSEPQRLSPKLAYRYIRQLGTATPLMILHTLADCAATGGPLSEGSWPRHVEAAQLVLGHYYAQDSVARPPQLLDGGAIMRLTGLPPGKLIGDLKEALLEATAAGEVTNLEEAEQLVQALLAARPDS